MKKITLLFTLLIFGFYSHAQLDEDFESGTTIPAGWTSFIGTNGEGTTQNWQINDGATNNVAFVTWEAVANSAEDWLVTPQFTVDATNFILSFDQSDSFAIDYGSTYTIRVSTASQTTHADFTIVDTQTELDVWSGGPLAQHTVDLTAYIGQPIYVAFVLEQNDGDRWIIDNVEMIADATAPDPVTTPTPADMAIDVVIDAANTNAVAFAWEAATTGDPATAYDFYLGDSPTTMNLLGTLGDTSVNITGMEYSTLYYWQIVAKNVGGDAVNSSTWSFTTEDDPNLSVDEFNINAFTVYPNPVNDVLNIKTNLTIENVEVYNQLGQRVLTVTKNQISGNSIDMSNLNNGIYIIEIASGDKKESFKIIKN
ncbi:choice-of-anchor J domain-containing protein [Oceanihabitans sp. 2_MG-2023]|uniref:T9SS-dependent choice-of-anchor J family protein n=1 Tax=Oceanihabitans sp. 2_MG-2023 TaxID=3062661 RepID=UPI0026E39E3B|nr:choice-of-anchor J domain-containing protein [Oceanihabitans sp. 2_MG-2023]MDO6596194.1 choice-of-anchor J domain-containing protein [Oceanihabitans sp. 2_MG-2023]